MSAATAELGQGAAGSTAIVTAGFDADRKVERALLAVAEHMGNTRKASASLKKDGIELSHPTLWKWSRKTHVDRYNKIRGEALPRIRAETADEHIELARLNMEAERLTLEQYKKKVGEMPSRDLPGASRNLAVGSAVHTEKAEMLNDRPTQRVAIDLAGTLAELKELGVEFIDGEVVSEEDVTVAVVPEQLATGEKP